MKKSMAMLGLAGAFIAFFITFGCERVDDYEKPEAYGNHQVMPAALQTGAVASTIVEIDKQIEWIAKGMVFSEHNKPGLNQLIFNEAVNDDFFEDELADAHLRSNASLGYSLQQEHDAEVLANVPGNTYDLEFFPGFEFQSEPYYTYCYIPDADSVDTTLKHIFIPERKKVIPPSGNTTAYFRDSLGNLDSLDLDEEEAPTDQYYIWIIGYSIEPDNSAYKKSRGTVEVNKYCGDSICDPSIGETPLNCPDCRDAVGNPVPEDPLYKIVLKNIDVYRDVAKRCGGPEKFLESWVANKYEFRFYGCAIRNDQVYDHVGTGCAMGEATPMGIYRIPRDEARRVTIKCNNNEKENVSASTALYINEMVLTDVKKSDELLLMVTEWDMAGSKSDHSLVSAIVCSGAGNTLFEDVIRTNSARGERSICPWGNGDDLSGGGSPTIFVRPSSFLSSPLIVLNSRFSVEYEAVPL